MTELKNLQAAPLEKQTKEATPLRTTETAVRIAIEQKGLDVKALDLRGISDIADYFVIVSGTSDRHLKGIADKISVELKKHGEAPLGISGYERGEWILMDYGDVVVHLFYEPTRQYYLFDDLWKNGKAVQLPADLEEQARKLRTGIYR